MFLEGKTNQVRLEKVKQEKKQKIEYILEVHDLRTYFYVPEGVVKAVNGVSFKLRKGEIVGLVGESGCGKSVTALSILKLIDRPGKIVSGSIKFYGENLLDYNEDEMRNIRGKRISIIFQDPMTSLNPLLTIGTQLIETISSHERIRKKDAFERSIKLLKNTGIPSPERRINDFPHQFSGGMRQRAMIAMALACNPDIIIADEPTTALDVTIQAQILDLLRSLVKEAGTSVIFITHDLGIVAETCKRAVIMYAGEVVEKARVKHIFKNPLHPYTKGLILSLPGAKKRGEKLFNIKGVVPIPINLPPGCLFYERCNEAMDGICNKIKPELVEVEEWHYVRCHKYTVH